MKYSAEISTTNSITGTLHNEIAAQHQKGYKHPHPVKLKRNALDDLISLECKKKDKSEVSSDLYSDRDDDRAKAVKDNYGDPYSSDSSGNGTRFANRTGIFSLDFPPSPKVPKGKDKKTRVMIQTPEPPTSDSDCTTILPTQTQELTVSAQHPTNSDSE